MFVAPLFFCSKITILNLFSHSFAMVFQTSLLPVRFLYSGNHSTSPNLAQTITNDRYFALRILQFEYCKKCANDDIYFFHRMNGTSSLIISGFLQIQQSNPETANVKISRLSAPVVPNLFHTCNFCKKLCQTVPRLFLLFRPHSQNWQ